MPSLVRRCTASPLALVLVVLALMILPAPPGAAPGNGRSAAVAQTVEPECSAFQQQKLPQGFEGCAALEPLAADPASFRGPEGFRLDEYEKVLDEFFSRYCHRNTAAGWMPDKRLRDVGPYAAILANGAWTSAKYYGTHQPVVIWYNPTMLEWLRKYRPHGEGKTYPSDPPPIPDGAIMVKEMYPAPAARCDRFPPEHLEPTSGVALMIRDNQNSQDGWFWGSWWKGFTPDWPANPAGGNGLPNMGFGQYCLNCHASAEDNSTFADLKNLRGEPGEVNVYLSQNFLFENSLTGPADPGRHRSATNATDDPERHDQPLKNYDPAFLARFPEPHPPLSAQPMPSQTYDNVWMEAGEPTAASEFVTSDQCIGCHDAGSTGLQFDMTTPDPLSAKLLNYSPYGTWRTSPMGLGGRDPIFFAQLASETETFHPDQSELIQDICLGCHGVMGQRQFAIDHLPPGCSLEPGASDPCPEFLRAYVNAEPYPSNAGDNPALRFAPYGALAREGIACSACHHAALTEEEIDRVKDQPQNRGVAQRQALLNPGNTGFARTFTGSFWVGPPAELKGPFTDPKTKPMEHALGVQPMHDQAIQSSDLCGACHTVHLPIFDGEKILGYTYEQTTYPEWAFSDYRTGLTAGGDELPAGAGPLAESCQACHMKSSGADGKPFVSKIASIQELRNFPQTDNTLPSEEIDLDPRPGFARHTLVGLNIFFVEMAQQFPSILGIRTEDPMMVKNGLDPILLTEREMLLQAATETAEVAVSDLAYQGSTLSATVTVTSKVGHKFPSGVGFRRAFLEFAVLDEKLEVLWASGRTDGAGTIVDARGNPLPGELWWKSDCSQRLPGIPHQPHYQKITAQDQAQIYQELVTSPAEGDPDPKCGLVEPVGEPTCELLPPRGQLTTSFLSICGHVKDNRILPHGFLPLKERIAISESLGAGPDLACDSGANNVGGDPDYDDGGEDSLVYEVDLSGIAGEPAKVRATLYFQAIPPFYLQDRFCTSKSADTERLYYLAGHLDLEDTPAESWKLAVVSSGLVEVD